MGTDRNCSGVARSVLAVLGFVIFGVRHLGVCFGVRHYMSQLYGQVQVRGKGSREREEFVLGVQAGLGNDDTAPHNLHSTSLPRNASPTRPSDCVAPV